MAKKKTHGFTDGVHYPRCFEGHKPLDLGGGLVIHGGSCIDPVVTDADIYIGFDSGMGFTQRQFPWNPGHEVLYRLADGTAPTNRDEWRKLVEWTAGQLQGGAKVHAGCIGGHGRTGTFLACLVKHMLGRNDAAAYVREHYCPKAIETSTQVEFLHSVWGIEKVAPRHGTGGTKSYGKSYGTSGKEFDYGWGSGVSKDQDSWFDQGKSDRIKTTPTTGNPVRSQTNIWGTTHVI